MVTIYGYSVKDLNHARKLPECGTGTVLLQLQSLCREDYGLVTMPPITAAVSRKRWRRLPTADRRARWCLATSCSWFGLANKEHVNVISLDTVNQTFTACESGAR